MICPNCGAQNRDDAKFCKSCGTPLKPPVPGAESALATLASAPPIKTSTSMVIGLEAVFLSGLRKGESVRLTTFPATIGRDPNSTLPLALHDQLASTRHAQILHEGDTYLLRDVGSSNGTYHNGQRVTEVRLQDADVIEFGVGGPKIRFNFIRQPETQPAPADRFEAVTLQPSPAVTAGTSDVTLPRQPAVTGDKPGPLSVTPSAAANAETVFGGDSPSRGSESALPPPPPPPPPFESAATVAQAVQPRPLEAPPPAYPPADYSPPVGGDPSMVSSPAGTTGNQSKLILFIALGGVAFIVFLVIVAVLAYVFLFQ